MNINRKIDYILIPMAGQGKRYKKENFRTIKPLILVDNETILEKSIKSLPNCNKKIAILKKNIFSNNLVINKIFMKEKINHFLLNKNTKGQADTIYKLKNNIDPTKNALVHSCDYIMKYSSKKFSKIFLNSDAIVFVYRLKSRIIKDYKSFAYCKINKKSNRVLKIVEKKIISNEPWNDYMAVGTFWFKKIESFFNAHEIALRKNQKINGEFYVANNINNLINLNYKVSFLEVDQWINLGDFFDFNQYLYYKNFFLNNNDLIRC